MASSRCPRLFKTRPYSSGRAWARSCSATPAARVGRSSAVPVAVTVEPPDARAEIAMPVAPTETSPVTWVSWPSHRRNSRSTSSTETPVCGITTRLWALHASVIASDCVALASRSRRASWSSTAAATAVPTMPCRARSGGTENASTTRPSARCAFQAIAPRAAAANRLARPTSARSPNPIRSLAICQPIRALCRRNTS